MNKEKLLKIKEQLKKSRPKFIRQDYQVKRLKKVWRAPKGIHSKLRRKFKGHIKQPVIGYRSPKPVRFLTAEGLKQILVKNIRDLKNIDSKNSILIIANIGLRKKLELLKKINELKFNVSNIKNIDDFIKQAEERLAERKKHRIELKKKKKEEKPKEKTKEVKEKPKTEEELKEEQEKKKKEEIKEQRKVLEKPQ